MESILHWVATYGYAAIFLLLVSGIVGLPVPEETLLVYSGYLIFKGTLDPVATLATATLGSWCGITCSYGIGRTLGIGVVHKCGRWLHVTEEDIGRVHDWFKRIGHWALFVGYYIPGVRHFTAIVAGTSLLEYRSFALFAYSGGVLWVGLFLSLGYFFGDQWQRAYETIHHHLTIAAIVAAALLGVYLLIRFCRRFVT